MRRQTLLRSNELLELIKYDKRVSEQIKNHVIF